MTNDLRVLTIRACTLHATIVFSIQGVACLSITKVLTNRKSNVHQGISSNNQKKTYYVWKWSYQKVLPLMYIVEELFHLSFFILKKRFHLSNPMNFFFQARRVFFLHWVSLNFSTKSMSMSLLSCSLQWNLVCTLIATHSSSNEANAHRCSHVQLWWQYL